MKDHQHEHEQYIEKAKCYLLYDLQSGSEVTGFKKFETYIPTPIQ